MFSENKQGTKVLISASILNLFLGIIYIWGIFVLPVSEHLNWGVESVRLVASFTIGFFSFANFIGGRLQQKFHATKITIVGGIMLSIGTLLAAFTPPSMPWLLYLTYGIMGGFGGGLGYIVVVAAVQKWFPEHRKVATGICVGIFGLSVTVFAPILTFVLREFSVQSTFIMLSISYLAVILIFGRNVRFPEENETQASPMYDKRQFTSSEMMRTREFFHLIASFLLVTAPFFVINPAVSTLTTDRGFTKEFATMLLMITGLSNTGGRFLIPIITKKMRNETVIVTLMIVQTLVAAFLSFATGPLFVLMVLLIPACFGAALSVFPLLAADYFGLQNVGANYGAIGLGFATSALVVPGLISMLGEYNVRFIAVAVLSAIGVYAMGWLMVKSKKQENSTK